MKLQTPRIPVIIGIGELIDKACDPALEPLEMLLRCTRAADEDAGGGWARHVDSLRIVNSMSWPYRDLAGLLARRLRLKDCEAIHGPVGGETPVKMLVELAQDIAEGYSEVALLCGAEATKTVMQAAMRGKTPQWSERDPEARRPSAEDYTTPICARYSLAAPVDVYPIYENATRVAWGQSFEEAQAESGTIWSNMARVAAENRYAWSGKPMAATDIVTASDSNRPIAFPYTKFQVAQIGVNQASAVILTHRDAALAAGVPEDKLIYVWAGAGAHEPYDILARDRYDHAPVLERVVRRALELNGLRAQDVDLFEFYSCFPVVPKLTRRALGLPADAPMTVAGGLTFFGGPTNNYMGHAITAMTRALRDGKGSKGFLHGNGEYVTKHYGVVLATTPPPAGIAVRSVDLQAECDAAYGPVPPLLENYEGPCRIETFTFTFDAKGRPDRGTVIARTPNGERVVARVTEAEPDAIKFLIDPAAKVVGAQGHIYDGGDGFNHFALVEPAVRPTPVVLFEKLTPHIALVTLNRADKRNAINGAITRLMVRYVKQIEEDPEIRVAILAAAPGPAFCAGADLAEAAAGRGEELMAGGNGFAGIVHAKRRKPWIAAVRGIAVGGGTEITLSCDLAVAGANASFGLPEVKRGLIPGAAGAYRLPRAVPPRVAMELILTGATITAQRALELNIVNRVVADDEVIAEARKLAEQIVENAPLAVYAAREVAIAAFDKTDAQLDGFTMQQAIPLFATEDFHEGPRAFLEKRKPVWKGK